MEVEPLNEATPTEPTPGEAASVRATPKADAHTEERQDDVSPIEEATPGDHYRTAPPKEDSRDQPASNVVERQIGGKRVQGMMTCHQSATWIAWAKP